MNAFRKMEWDCVANGCFNRVRRIDFGHFSDCFPGRISMSDVDGTVEVNGHFLFLEMKSNASEIPTGQRIYFQRLTALSPKIAVMVIFGTAETMACYAVRRVYLGQVGDWEKASLDDIKSELRDWVSWCFGRKVS